MQEQTRKYKTKGGGGGGGGGGDVSHPDSQSDPIGGSEPSSGCETIYWDSLSDFFFKSRTYTCGYGPHLIT